MENWIFNPNDYEEKDFAPIPKGDHRVRIMDVQEKTFRSGNHGYEITMEVSGYNSRVWHYLVINRDDPKKTNQKIGSLFDSFGITDYDMTHFRNWIGKVGAVRIVHEDYNGEQQAKVAYCIPKKKQDKLPPWKENSSAPSSAVSGYETIDIDDDDLPFS